MDGPGRAEGTEEPPQIAGAGTARAVAAMTEWGSSTASARKERLSAFSPARIASVAAELQDEAPRAWPPLDGVLAVIFASRSGSTFLARELERAFAIGRMQEALNPPWLVGHPPDRVLRGAENGWFGFKAGGPGVIAGELAGFFDAYLPKARFLRLLRRDLVAQAVSREKAVQTGRYAFRQAARAEARYDAGSLARGVGVIAGVVESLGAWLDRTERPCRTLIYEDFAGGDLEPALAACEALGAPRRDAPDYSLPAVRKLGDAQNLEWAERFLREADPAARAHIERYDALVAALSGTAGAPAA